MRIVLLLMFLMLAGGVQRTVGQDLESLLLSVPAGALAEDAKSQGDAARGAVLFFQPHMACSRCHAVGSTMPKGLGPDLAAIGPAVSDEELVTSVLNPSKAIRQGFASIVVRSKDGQTRTGLLVERNSEKLVLRDVASGDLVNLPSNQIDEVRENQLSIMPTGQMNQLASRQQFLDLIRYLMEIRDGGARRASELQPSANLLVHSIPEFESHLDHAGLIGTWDSESLKRGEAIYSRVCMNCHGTKDQLGSLPTSLRFAEGKFKNGSDPLAMYQTLTKGFGQMTPQSWMVPSQKYDVIHYIRETYLKPFNPSQYLAVDGDYVTRLPKGDTFGPEPSKIDLWSAMDYGPTLTHTYQIPGSRLNLAYKGIAVRLDPGAGGIARGKHWVVFDTDTLRLAAAWTARQPAEAFIDWRSIQFNGQHQVHPSVVGRVDVANSVGPGWADPASGQFEDNQRVVGRDGRHYGPLPRAWGQFRGLYHHGDQAVFSYTIGATEIIEAPMILPEKKEVHDIIFVRRFEIGPRDKDLVLQVAEANEAGPPLLYGATDKTNSLEWIVSDEQLRLRIPAGNQPLNFAVWLAKDNRPPAEGSTSGQFRSGEKLVRIEADIELRKLTRGGPARWPQKLETPVVSGAEDGPLAVDTLTAPEVNPWLAQTRFSGLDFFSDGRLAICSWDGDVWVVDTKIVTVHGVI